MACWEILAMCHKEKQNAGQLNLTCILQNDPDYESSLAASLQWNHEPNY